MSEFESVCYSHQDNVGGGNASELVDATLDLGSLITPFTPAERVVAICDRFGITPADVSAYVNRNSINGNPGHIYVVDPQNIVDEMMNS
jgi:hypothetical protein